MGLADELTRLQSLRDSGALSDDEFQRAKARVLAGDDELRHSQCRKRCVDVRSPLHQADDVGDAAATRQREPLSHEGHPMRWSAVEVVAHAPDHERRADAPGGEP